MKLLEILEKNTFREEVKTELVKRIQNNQLTYSELERLIKVQKIRENHPKVFPKDKILISIDEIDGEIEFYRRQRRYSTPLRKSRERMDQLLNSRYGL